MVIVGVTCTSNDGGNVNGSLDDKNVVVNGCLGSIDEVTIFKVRVCPLDGGEGRQAPPIMQKRF